MPIRDITFPHVKTVINGRIVEIHEYLTKTLKYYDNSCVVVLSKVTREDNVNEKGLRTVIKRLAKKRKAR